MRNFYKSIFFCFSFVLFGYIPTHAKEISQERPLSEALEELGEKHQVFFTYNLEELDKVDVYFEIENSEQLDTAINRLLKNTKFSFASFGEKYYVIYENSQRGKKYLEKALYHLSEIDKLEKEGLLVNKKSKNQKKQYQQISKIAKEEQQLTISGQVTEENGIPLAGATVLVKETTNGVTTDFDGGFSIKVPNKNAILVFSYIGYSTNEVQVNDKTIINVALKESTESLNEIVVQAYRNTSTKKNSAAITTVNKDVIENTPSTNALNALQSRVAGLNIASGSGQPGAATTVRIRGTGTLSANAEPLYIIDGTPVSRNFSGINPNDIESISVLKDAAATAAYGNRSANGVIIITTKKGSYNSGLEVSYSESFGRTYQQENTYGLMNSKDLLTLQKNIGSGRGATMTDAEINELANQTNTDWADIILQKGTLVNRQLSFSSGGENTKSYISFSQAKQEGIVKKTGLERYSFRSNITGKSSNDKFNYAVDFTVAAVKVDYAIPNRITDNGLVFVNPIAAALWSQPFLDPYRPDGTINDDTLDELPALSGSPYVILNNYRYNENQNRQLKSVVNLDMSYKILKNVKVAGKVGIDYEQIETLETRSPESTSRLFDPSPTAKIQGRQRESFFRDFSINTLGSINYNNTFGAHTIDATAFVESLQVYRKSFGFAAFGLDPRTYSPGDGAAFTDGNIREDGDNLYVPDISSDKGEAGLFSYFGIVDYDYNSRFGLTATLRRDASFRFATTYRWGTFYSVSGRWNLDQEAFIKPLSFINTLKLRASHGSTGNERAFGADILDGASAIRTLYSTGTGYNNTTSLYVENLGSYKLKWETTVQTNVGLDFGFFQNKLSGSMDVYRKNAKDLFLPGPISAATGQYNLVQNLGTIRNQGIELAISYDVLRSDDLNITLRANGSYNKNEIIELKNQPDGKIDDKATIQPEGNPINSYFLVPYVGVNPANGNALYRKLDGSITEVFSNDDRVIAGSIEPKYQGGFGLEANYKGLFFTSDFSFLADVKRYNDQLRFFSSDPFQSVNFNVSADYNRAWTPDNRITDVEGLLSNRNQFGSTKFLHDASYLRLRDLTFGYNFTSAVLRVLPIKSCRVYVRGQNLLTWSKWRGLDVEAAVNRSFDFSDYPTPRIFSAGIDITF